MILIVYCLTYNQIFCSICFRLASEIYIILSTLQDERNMNLGEFFGVKTDLTCFCKMELVGQILLSHQRQHHLRQIYEEMAKFKWQISS